MQMRTHELHPALIHAPLVLLPASAIVDLVSATTGNPIRRRVMSVVGRRLWWGTAASALLAGLAGMASSQEIESDEHLGDMMFVHGAGNLALVVAAFGVAAWRTSHRATLATALLGTGAVVASTYTAWLGGEMVYSHGAGVKEAGKMDASREKSPPLLSARAPATLARDAVYGLGWLMKRLTRVARRRESIHLQPVRPAAPTTAVSEGQFTAPY